jgi:hypothetical protein
MQQSYSASGVPYSILDTLKSQMNGGALKSVKAKTSGGVKSKSQFTKDRKLLLEAWKLFRKDVKIVKDKYLKDKIRKVERVFKSKYYGGELNGKEDDENGDVINKETNVQQLPEEVETPEEVEKLEEPSSDEPSLEELNSSVKDLKESFLTLQSNMGAVLDKLGLNKGIDSETVKVALKNVEKFVEECSKKSESTFSGGKSKKVKKGGNILQDQGQGQYAINNIYSLEKGSSVTIGGKKSKRESSSRIKKGGEYAACNNTTTFTNVTGSDSSYNLLNNDAPFTSQYALVPPELTPSSALTSSSMFHLTPDAVAAPMAAPMVAPMAAPTSVDSNAAPTSMDSNAAPTPVTSGGGKKYSKGDKKGVKKGDKKGGNFGLPGDLHNLLSPSTLTPEKLSVSGGSKKKSYR